MANKKQSSSHIAKPTRPARKKQAEKKPAAGNNYSPAHGCNVVVHQPDESRPTDQ